MEFYAVFLKAIPLVHMVAAESRDDVIDIITNATNCAPSDIVSIDSGNPYNTDKLDKVILKYGSGVFVPTEKILARYRRNRNNPPEIYQFKFIAVNLRIEFINKHCQHLLN